MPTILLVEDNELNSNMLSRRLQRKGFEVVLAMNGADGVRAAQQHRPDLILMDMNLPVVDGWEATRQLKNSPDTQLIPIIAQTAHAMAGDREKCLAIGCDDYATKPINFGELLEQIEKLLA
ncbi:MAG: response regulator [Anaerolineales bacterium]|nr:response regulator [Anaerolineales bacterium]